MWSQFLVYQKKVAKKIITFMHSGIYKCAFELKGRVKKEELKLISEKFLKLTREVIVQQKAQSTLEKGSYSDAVKHPKCTRIQYLLMI